MLMSKRKHAEVEVETAFINGESDVELYIDKNYPTCPSIEPNTLQNETSVPHMVLATL
jgi:hypothetical protein